MSRTSPGKQLLWVLAGLLAAFLALAHEQGWLPLGPSTQTAPQTPPEVRAERAGDAAASDLFPDPVELREVRAALARIAAGGPFPYRKDGTVFRNREGQLPRRPSGYYREYTVETPGEDDRGARRIVQGRDGDTWYTRDHYGTFIRIDPEEVRGDT